MRETVLRSFAKVDDPCQEKEKVDGGSLGKTRKKLGGTYCLTFVVLGVEVQYKPPQAMFHMGAANKALRKKKKKKSRKAE